MPNTLHHATHNDTPMIIIQKQPESVVLPICSSSYGYDPRIHLQNQPRHSVEPEYDHPLISTPHFSATSFQLLHIADQYSVESLSSAVKLQFPWKIDIYDPNRQPMQWKSRAHFEGEPLEGSPNSYFTANGGLTKRDRLDIHQDLKLGAHLENVWE